MYDAGFRRLDPSTISVKDETKFMEPLYSCSLTLYEEKTHYIKYQKQIRFHIGVLDFFFTIYGLDIVEILNIEGDNVVETEPVLTVSPINEYVDAIPKIRSIVDDIYSNMKYVSYYYLKKRINALSVAGAHTTDFVDASVFQALFTYEDLAKFKFQGDIYYE